MEIDNCPVMMGFVDSQVSHLCCGNRRNRGKLRFIMCYNSVRLTVIRCKNLHVCICPVTDSVTKLVL